jgi:hypothetical protein
MERAKKRMAEIALTGGVNQYYPPAPGAATPDKPATPATDAKPDDAKPAPDAAKPAPDVTR